jgi:hypothetical protein
VAVGSVLEGTPAVHAQPKYAWKMVTAWPKDFPGVGTGASRLARAIERMSDKRITVTVYSDGELVPAFDTFDAVASGTAEMGHTSALYWQVKHAATPFFATVPFGLNAQEMAAWLYYGGGQALWDELYAPFNLKPFAAGSSGAQMGGWFNNAVLATLGNVSQEVVAAVAAYDPLARKVYDAFHALRQMSKAPLDRPLQSAYGLAIVVPLILDVADEVKGALVGMIPLDTLEQRVAERTEQLAEANAEITALNIQLQAENLRMGAELEVTRKLQQMLLPTAEELQQIADLDIACYMEPADEVGGDYYDVLQHNGQIKIGIGDKPRHDILSASAS